MGLYCGIDLHSNNHWLTVIAERDGRVVERRLANDMSLPLRFGEAKAHRNRLVEFARCLQPVRQIPAFVDSSTGKL